MYRQRTHRSSSLRCASDVRQEAGPQALDPPLHTACVRTRFAGRHRDRSDLEIGARLPRAVEVCQYVEVVEHYSPVLRTVSPAGSSRSVLPTLYMCRRHPAPFMKDRRGLYCRLADSPTRDWTLNALVARLRLRYRYPGILLRAMVVTDFKLRYQASVLGYLWTLLRPLGDLHDPLHGVRPAAPDRARQSPYTGHLPAASASSSGDSSQRRPVRAWARLWAERISSERSASRATSWCVSVGVSALISFGLNMVVIVLFMTLAQVSRASDRALAAAAVRRAPCRSPLAARLHSLARCSCAFAT